jgi:hypothetical protein
VASYEIISPIPKPTPESPRPLLSGVGFLLGPAEGFLIGAVSLFN